MSIDKTMHSQHPEVIALMARATQVIRLRLTRDVEFDVCAPNLRSTDAPRPFSMTIPFPFVTDILIKLVPNVWNRGWNVLKSGWLKFRRADLLVKNQDLQARLSNFEAPENYERRDGVDFRIGTDEAHCPRCKLLLSREDWHFSCDGCGYRSPMPTTFGSYPYSGYRGRTS